MLFCIYVLYSERFRIFFFPNFHHGTLNIFISNKSSIWFRKKCSYLITVFTSFIYRSVRPPLSAPRKTNQTQMCSFEIFLPHKATPLISCGYREQSRLVFPNSLFIIQKPTPAIWMDPHRNLSRIQNISWKINTQ